MCASRKGNNVEQKIITPENDYAALDQWIAAHRADRLMLVCGTSLARLRIREVFERLEKQIHLVKFSDFLPNPTYDAIVKGVMAFRENRCNAIIAVGGGSAMDVAKCIRLFSPMKGNGEDGGFLRQPILPNAIPFLAVPTTAGSGSEATRFAVIYYEGQKQSIADPGCLPGTVLMDPAALKSLPLYQKKATMLDALCHAMESFWSVNSTEESREYSRQAITEILTDMEGYLANEDPANAGMQHAAWIAGKAINITQTTAGHAMCYRITGLFQCAHGHAAALCVRVLYPWMIENTALCTDPRGAAYLRQALDELGRALGCPDAAAGAEKLNRIFTSLDLAIPAATPAQYAELKTSVNPVRLKNHPVALDESTIDQLYHRILR